MSNFDFLKQYIIKNQKVDISNMKHCFYKVSTEEIQEAENRIAFEFPKELKEFYSQIGYGFICKDDTSHTNRLTFPEDIADRILYKGDIYDYLQDEDEWLEDELPFFNLDGEDGWITIKLSGQDKDSIFYFGEKIAQSLEEFLIKMDSETNYYMHKRNI